MTEKRFQIIGENYTNIDIPVFVICRENDCCFEVYESKEDAQIVCDNLNKLVEENEQLKNRVDELEDDNMKYTLSTDKLDGYTKRFMPTKCINEFRDCKTNRYYWLDNEDNFTGALELLNLLDCENEQLKQENENLKSELNQFEPQLFNDLIGKPITLYRKR